MNLTLSITCYNRIQYLPESFAQVINHPRITEIILMDDCSDMEIFKQIEALKDMSPKIKVYRQAKNRNMSRNKADAVSYASNEWVILFDSDNVIGPDYVDAIPLGLSATCIYQPDFAKPNFDFRKYSGQSCRRFSTVNHFIKQSMFFTMINACNYVVNRDQYMAVYQENHEHKASDTVWFFYLWMKSGGDMYVVPGMQYFHRVWDKSAFLADADYNMKQAEKVRKLIMQL